MKRLAVVGLVVVAASALGPAAAQTPPAQVESQPIFKSGTELVALNVTVTDPRQNYVAGLAANDFAVYEDGVKQEVSFFAASEIPIDLILLVDSSSSMADKMSVAREAALGFIRTLRSGDRAAIVAFNDTTKVLQPLTGEIQHLEAAIGTTHPSGATALNNALYVALREFGRSVKQAGEVRRQAIAVFSDGEDTASLMTFDEVLNQARRSGVSIYTIALQSRLARQNHNGRRYFSQSDFSMKTLAQDTGGLSFFPEKIQDLAGVYGRIAADIGAQYSMAYAPKNGRTDGRFRRVVVQVLSRPDARPRTRLGYFADVLRAASSIVR
ncbi:MAG TPA: VWA domain-containing protein [Vicinamibacterales bacterium]|jgi:Ca-activated chloride channel homolog|nr:VWA domain-containing protein [Vicinamibacterales bacterium]